MDNFTYQDWRVDAQKALTQRYSASDASIVVCWFDTIKASGEYRLVGKNVVDCLVAVAESDKHFNLYNNLMMRLWLYAPYILAEVKL